MNAKIVEIESLLGLGWEVDDIVSDDRVVEVLLRRGPSRVTVFLDTQDAWDVLSGEGLPTAPREDAMLAPPH